MVTESYNIHTYVCCCYLISWGLLVCIVYPWLKRSVNWHMLPQTRRTPCCILDRWSDKEQIREILLFMHAQYSYPRLAPISVCCESLSIHFTPIHQGYKALWQPKCRRKNFIENGYMNNMDPLTTTIRPLESKAQHSNVHIHGYTAQGCNRPQFSMAYDDHRNGYQQSMKSLEITIHLVHVIGKPDGGWIYTQRVIYNKKQEYCTRYPPCCAALKLHNRWSVLLMFSWATSLQEHKKRVHILREVLEITMFREVDIFRRGLKCQYPPIGVIGTMLCNNSPFHIVLTFSIAVTMVLLSNFVHSSSNGFISKPRKGLRFFMSTLSAWQRYSTPAYRQSS